MHTLNWKERCTANITAAIISISFYDNNFGLYLLFYIFLSTLLRAMLVYIKNWTGGDFQ